jgi:hypothetical protein
MLEGQHTKLVLEGSFRLAGASCYIITVHSHCRYIPICKADYVTDTALFLNGRERGANHSAQLAIFCATNLRDPST